MSTSLPIIGHDISSTNLAKSRRARLCGLIVFESSLIQNIVLVIIFFGPLGRYRVLHVTWTPRTATGLAGAGSGLAS